MRFLWDWAPKFVSRAPNTIKVGVWEQKQGEKLQKGNSVNRSMPLPFLYDQCEASSRLALRLETEHLLTCYI